ncbi:galactose-1-phosphate uridylyltransferase [Peribacillus deserti]|uniref:Galactose-1-phosphate uridylyltransferase n=1 Tax=Peribacillus deserti TaxID=673318 RepID=A0ABS2QE09_9BACI|nr:DUF4931 domain-containing protein [Peribacillus deserti]MBM7691374.1 galactose-1-phosphate uridylyltransferase [Peribacillus deserti]
MEKENDLLFFQNNIGLEKPNSMVNRKTDCPFCNRESLTDILDQKGPILYLKNKFPTLKDTFQTLIIETDDCHADISTYKKTHLLILLEFAIKKWEEMIHTKEYKSVIFYKNHGPLSGGTIHHPHMQIVGLKYADYNKKILNQYFAGLPIAEDEEIVFNVSTHPIMGFVEFNIILKNKRRLDTFADFLQITAHYILNHLHKSCNSYNLFFYHREGAIICKVVPRFVASPLFIGYSLSQVSNNLEETIKKIRTLYHL